MKSGFGDSHPAVSFSYFCLMLGFTMFFSHPLCRLFSLLGACLFFAQSEGGGALLRQTRFLLPLMLLAVVINPAFSHEGVTVLAYFPSGNPLTLESVFYGFSMALLLAAVIVWFLAFSKVMTGEKLACLFGGRLPALTLLLTMTLGLVPRFQTRFRQVREAQEGIGQGITEGSLKLRLRCAGRILSILLTCTLEDAIETADSMKSRGYGAPGRTAFSPYHFSSHDKRNLFTIILLAAGILLLTALGEFRFHYYPALASGGLAFLALGALSVYLAFCLTPWMIEWWEAHQWRSMKFQN